MLRCSVCGEEINDKWKNCPSCGASLIPRDKKPLFTNGKTIVDSKVEQTKKESVKRNKKSNVIQKSEKSISVSSTKLFYLFLFLVLAGAILIYSSGVLDSTPGVLPSQVAGNTNPNAGVDLRNLEQINSLQTIVDKNPSDKETLLQLAHLYNDSGLKPKAIERYSQYLKMNPKNADVWVDMGVCYFETGKNDDAISSMERALKINPRHQIANLNLGIVNLTAGNTEKAIGYWKKAIEIDPTNEIGQKAKELITTHKKEDVNALR